MQHLQVFDKESDLESLCPKCGYEGENAEPPFAVRFVPEVPYSGIGERMEVYCRFCGFGYHRLPLEGE